MILIVLMIQGGDNACSGDQDQDQDQEQE